MTSEFTLVEKFSILSQENQSAFKRMIAPITRSILVRKRKIDFDLKPDISFIGILFRGKLSAFTLFEEEGEKCDLHYLCSEPTQSLNAKFRKEFGTTPARYLLETLVRKGTRVFITSSLSRFSKRTYQRLNQKGLAEKMGRHSPAQRITRVSPKGIQQATSRKWLLR